MVSDIFNDLSNEPKKYYSFKGMFCPCLSLEYLPDISNWNTSNVFDFSGMFADCFSLKSLHDISKLDKSNAIYMNSMFGNCRSLISFPDISKWNTENVIDMKFLVVHLWKVCLIYPNGILKMLEV